MKATVHTVSEILKEFYLPAVTKQLNEEMIMLRKKKQLIDFSANLTGANATIGTVYDLGALSSSASIVMPTSPVRVPTTGEFFAMDSHNTVTYQGFANVGDTLLVPHGWRVQPGNGATWTQQEQQNLEANLEAAVETKKEQDKVHDDLVNAVESLRHTISTYV